MKYKIFFMAMMSLCACYSGINAMEITEIVTPLRVAFFIDDTTERFAKGDSKGALSSELIRALSGKAVHLIISSNYILKNVILRKYTKNPHHFFAQTNFDLHDWDVYAIDNTQFYALVLHGYDNPIFNKEQWTFVDLSVGDEYNGEGNQKFPKISWADDAPTQAKRLLNHKNMKYIIYAKDAATDVPEWLTSSEASVHKKFDPKQLSLIFKAADNYDELGTQWPCNIFMLGHGTYSLEESNLGIIASLLAIVFPRKHKEFLMAGMPLKDITKVLLFFNDKLNTKSVRILSCYAGGENLDRVRAQNDIPIRMKYLCIINSITDSSTMGLSRKWYQGANLKEYFEALDDFQGSGESFQDAVIDIKSGFLGSPQMIKSEIRKLENNSGFNKVLQSLSLLHGWYLLYSGLNNFPQFWIPEIGWFQTFDISQAVQKITDVHILISKIKPGFLIDLETLDVLYSMLEKGDYAFLQSPLKFSAANIEVKNKLALLVYSAIVFVNLNIIPNSQLRTANLYKSDAYRWLLNLYRYFPSIPCLDTVYSEDDHPVEKTFYIYPEFVSMQRGDSLNIFAKITLEDAGNPTMQTGILNFLRDSFLLLRGRKSKKTFFIKELEGFNDFSEVLDEKDSFQKFLVKKNRKNKRIVLHNVFIKTYRDDLTRINIFFQYEGKSWGFSCGEEGLNKEKIQAATVPEDRSKSLWKFEELPAIYETHLKESNLTYLAELSPAQYYDQLPVIREIFHHQATRVNIKKPSDSLSLKDFLANLNLEEIKERVKFEQETQLKLRLLKLKGLLAILAQKLSILSLKLNQLRKQLSN